MNERLVIIVGDKTSHGGKVLTGSAADRIDGKAIARVGDWVSCRKHGRNLIVEGSAVAMINGTPVAVEGCKTECGITLIAVQMDMTLE